MLGVRVPGTLILLIKTALYKRRCCRGVASYIRLDSKRRDFQRSLRKLPDGSPSRSWDYRCCHLFHRRTRLAGELPTGERSGLQTHIVTGSYFVRADEKLTAFVELERVIHQFAVSLLS